jgi:hypothetical protein
MGVGRCAAASVGVAAALIVGPAGPVIAAPDQGGDPISCAYALKPVGLTDVSGVTMVSTALPPAQCQGRANSIHTSACLTAQGSEGPALCQRASGQNTAVVFTAYRPGTTYVATGSGCATGIDPVRTYCTSVGPLTVTL